MEEGASSGVFAYEIKKNRRKDKPQMGAASLQPQQRKAVTKELNQRHSMHVKRARAIQLQRTAQLPKGALVSTRMIPFLLISPQTAQTMKRTHTFATYADTRTLFLRARNMVTT